MVCGSNCGRKGGHRFGCLVYWLSQSFYETRANSRGQSAPYSQGSKLSNKTVAYILFALAGVMLVLGWVVQGLPPAVTGIGFAVIGYYILRTK
mgnify:CR=1 FL=1